MERSYDEADALILAASDPDLGAAELGCEREFTPLRWIVRTDRDGPFARLLLNTDNVNVAVERYDFALPAEPKRVSGPYDAVRHQSGGLLMARANTFTASIILPPKVRYFSDLRRTRVVPHVAPVPNTTDGLLKLIRLSGSWASASLPGNPFGRHQRTAVFRALTSLVSTVSGRHWSEIEDQGLSRDEFNLPQMQAAVGIAPYQQALAEAISRRLVSWYDLEPAKRVVELTAVLSIWHRRTSVASSDRQFVELLLRLASEPASLTDWSVSELRAGLARGSAIAGTHPSGPGSWC